MRQMFFSRELSKEDRYLLLFLSMMVVLVFAWPMQLGLPAHGTRIRAGARAMVQASAEPAPLYLASEQVATSSMPRQMFRSAHVSTHARLLSSCASGSHSYVVVAGETLSGIAARFGTTWMALADFNHLAHPNLLAVKQLLCIPDTGASVPSGLHPQTAVTPRSAAIMATASTAYYEAMARSDAINAGIPAIYFVRQINQESGFNPTASSFAGAVGIAQFLPSTAAQYGINPWDPLQALLGAAHLMASYVNQYGGNYAMALAAYNAGTGTVSRAVTLCGSNWRSCLPAETQNYIFIIIGSES